MYSRVKYIVKKTTIIEKKINKCYNNELEGKKYIFTSNIPKIKYLNICSSGVSNYHRSA